MFFNQQFDFNFVQFGPPTLRFFEFQDIFMLNCI